MSNLSFLSQRVLEVTFLGIAGIQWSIALIVPMKKSDNFHKNKLKSSIDSVIMVYGEISWLCTVPKIALLIGQLQDFLLHLIIGNSGLKSDSKSRKLSIPKKFYLGFAFR